MYVCGAVHIYGNNRVYYAKFNQFFFFFSFFTPLSRVRFKNKLIRRVNVCLEIVTAVEKYKVFFIQIIRVQLLRSLLSRRWIFSRTIGGDECIVAGAKIMDSVVPYFFVHCIGQPTPPGETTSPRYGRKKKTGGRRCVYTR